VPRVALLVLDSCTDACAPTGVVVLHCTLVWIGACRYSDAHVLKDGSVAVAFQKTFDPPVPSIEGGGYDVGLAIFKTKSKTETRG
jgi:hypothetical protein